MSIQIPLTKNFIALVDDNFEYFLNYNWYAHNSNTKENPKWYAARKEYIDGKLKTIYMHRMIAEILEGKILTFKDKVDHWDSNGFNNLSSNIRVTTTSGNGANRGIQSNNQSGFARVTWHKAANKWRASITKNRKSINLNHFNDIIEAAKEADRGYIWFFPLDHNKNHLNFPELYNNYLIEIKENHYKWMDKLQP